MSNKAPESSVRAVVVVVIIAALCAAGLAFVKEVTEEPIAEARRQETLAALQRVVPKGCEIKLEGKLVRPEGAEESASGTRLIFPGYDAKGELCGIAVRARNDKGYSGKILVVAGFSGLKDKFSLKLNRIYVTEHAETPGLGSLVTNMQEEDPAGWGKDRSKVFGLNYLNKMVSDLTWTVAKAADAGDNDVVAVTAATISSRAVTWAVEDAAKLVVSELDGFKAAFPVAMGGKK
jgi:Na+-translocating ferredoxin:NAD+ oxidoreductase subunit G